MNPKRTKYVVRCGNEHVARFSDQWHARVFAIALSERMPNHLIEMSAPDGLIGQYRGGDTTPEFKQHHISGLFEATMREQWADKKCPKCGYDWFGCLNPDCPVPLSLRSPHRPKKGHDTGGDW